MTSFELLNVPRQSPEIYLGLDVARRAVLEIENATRVAAARISDGLQAGGIPEYIAGYMPQASYEFSPELGVTDRAGKIFPVGESLFTITSTLALEYMAERGTPLLPADQHIFEDVRTHRGIGLVIASELMNALGIGSRGNWERFVWLGTAADSQEFTLENAIARRGPQVDRDIAAIFFDNFDTSGTACKDLRLHPLLQGLFDAINNEDVASYYEQDSSRSVYVDNLLLTLYNETGLRGNALKAIRSILYGHDPPGCRFVDTDSLIYNFRNAASPVPKASEAVIIEIDSAEHFRGAPFYLFPIGARPPAELVPAQSVVPDTMLAVYTLSGQADLGVFSDLQRPLDRLPARAWLGGVPVSQNHASNQWDPACMARYAQDPTMLWGEAISEGHMTLWWNNRHPDLRSPKTLVDHALRRLIVGRIERSTHDVSGQVIDRVVHELNGEMTVHSVGPQTGLQPQCIYYGDRWR